MFASQFLKKKKSQTLNRNVNKIFFDDIPRHFDTANLLGREAMEQFIKQSLMMEILLWR